MDPRRLFARAIGFVNEDFVREDTPWRFSKVRATALLCSEAVDREKERRNRNGAEFRGRTKRRSRIYRHGE